MSGQMDKYCLCLGRQLGSGGYEIARRLAGRLGLQLFDKEVLLEAAKASGVVPAMFLGSDEERSGRRRGALMGGLFASGMRLWADSGYTSAFDSKALFHIMSETIQRLAEEGNCLFVGRCAEYILRYRTDVVSVFIAADKQDRIARVAHAEGIGEREAHRMINRVDKQRAAYHDFYAHGRWGQPSTYDLCINTSRCGLDDAVEIIVGYVKRRVGSGEAPLPSPL